MVGTGDDDIGFAVGAGVLVVDVFEDELMDGF